MSFPRRGHGHHLRLDTHNDNASYNILYRQANATLNESTRKHIEHEMQQIDFTQGA